AALGVSEDQRANCVDRACAGRPGVRAEVEALLSVRGQAAAAFASPPMMAWGDLLPEPATLVGQRLGSYRVVRLLGAGGMGEVYLAERDDDQFHRQVAIKMVAASIASPEVLARFSGEREIL